MLQHAFILSPYPWLGEGKIRLNMVEEELGFVTRWKVSNKDAGGIIECVQEIQVKGLADIMLNQFVLYDFSGNHFSIDLENPALGKITGSGLIEDHVIAWEFRIQELGFEGFEFYEKESADCYRMRAEYATTDQYRTVINGKVWRPAKL